MMLNWGDVLDPWTRT